MEISLVEAVAVHISKVQFRTEYIELPYVEIPVHAGFPSPADDYIESRLDLLEHLIHHPSSTYYIKVSGDSMMDYGIFDGDLLIVDRSLEPRQGDIVIAALDGELTCKSLAIEHDIPYLKSGNPNYPPIRITNKEIYIWGVIIHTIHSFRTHHK
ncbi:translesion error-prone DNA polymerase V autoproteolytic subunit [Commensalibacter sp. Nvir]|uniref:LexA family protein n=1 Tax=Commensalibacter sp. Nvir TaxID=3069817 RepID=UPI0030C872BB